MTVGLRVIFSEADTRTYFCEEIGDIDEAFEVARKTPDPDAYLKYLIEAKTPEDKKIFLNDVGQLTHTSLLTVSYESGTPELYVKSIESEC